MTSWIARMVRRSPPLLLGAALACSSNADGTGSPPLTAAIASLHACVYESRSVQYCGGATTGVWVSYCNDTPCPMWLDDHEITFLDPGGDGTCGTGDEYRHVFDFAGSCDDWVAQGRPLMAPSPLYCGYSLLYNEFGEGEDLQDVNCSTCMQTYCPQNYQACYPVPYTDNRCDDLIRCLRSCAVGDAAASAACMQAGADVVDAASAFSTCASQSCSDSCD
jgi:hypothetical protein